MQVNAIGMQKVTWNINNFVPPLHMHRLLHLNDLLLQRFVILISINELLILLCLQCLVTVDAGRYVLQQ